MNKLINKFKKVVKYPFKKYKLLKKPLRLMIPISAFIIVGIILGTIIYIDYNRTPLLNVANISSDNTVESTQAQYTIKGFVEYPNGAVLFINKNNIKINNDGSFSYTVDLLEGNNDVEVKLVKNGKEIKNRYIVNRVVDKTIAATGETEAKSQDTTPNATSSSTPIPITAPTPKPTPTSTPTPAPTQTQTPTPPVVVPEVSQPEIRIEVSSDGCVISIYAPEYYFVDSEYGLSSNRVILNDFRAQVSNMTLGANMSRTTVWSGHLSVGHFHRARILTSDTGDTSKLVVADSGDIDILNDCN